MTMLPSMVLSAFSCELYLKCLLHLEGQSIPPTHHLRAIFKRLSPRTRDSIENRWLASQQDPQNVRMREAILKLTGEHPSTDFRKVLSESSQGFVDLRYIHEQTNPNSRYGLCDLPRILRHTVVEKRPEWAPLGPGTPQSIDV